MGGPEPFGAPADDADTVYLRLMAQHGLLGNIGPHVRAVAVSYRNQAIVFDGLVDPDATEEERDDLDDAATELIAAYGFGWTLEVNIRSGEDDLPAWPARVFHRSSR